MLTQCVNGVSYFLNNLKCQYNQSCNAFWFENSIKKTELNNFIQLTLSVRTVTSNLDDSIDQIDHFIII